MLKMTAEQKFKLWFIGAAVGLSLSVLVGFLESPRWAVAPLIGITLLCCIGMINNTALEQVRDRKSSTTHPSKGSAGSEEEGSSK